MHRNELSPAVIPFIEAVHDNCELSDAKDCGIYSMCTLFLRLRNLYKWQQRMPPWEEADPKDLLRWIEKKEQRWEAIHNGSFSSLPLNGTDMDPFDLETVNGALQQHHPGLLYGAGHGRSLKAVFFLAEITQVRTVENHPLFICDREICRELSSPFAMHQEGTIFFRLSPFRYFLWDKIQEGAASRARAIRYALSQYGVVDQQGSIDHQRLRRKFEEIVLAEMEAIIGHEIGELSASPLSGRILADLLHAYAASPIELVARGTKDILADTCAGGMLDRIIANRMKAALGFYVAMLDGMRRELFPELTEAFTVFLEKEEWSLIDRARESGFSNNMQRAGLLRQLTELAHGSAAPAAVRELEKKVLSPIGLNMPERNEKENSGASQP